MRSIVLDVVWCQEIVAAVDVAATYGRVAATGSDGSKQSGNC